MNVADRTRRAGALHLCVRMQQAWHGAALAGAKALGRGRRSVPSIRKEAALRTHANLYANTRTLVRREDCPLQQPPLGTYNALARLQRFQITAQQRDLLLA